MTRHRKPRSTRGPRSGFSRRGALLSILGGLSLTLLARRSAFASPDTIRLGLLTFGSVRFEIAYLQKRVLKSPEAFALEVVELASNEAAKLALLAGGVDAIVSDWIWAARMRAQGEDLVFLPYSAAVGSLLAAKEQPDLALSSLAGKRVGVAGGALDKSWLLLRALMIGKGLADPAGSCDLAFGAPPLLSAQLRAGRLDALLTTWTEAALLEDEGAQEILSVRDMVRALGIEAGVPLLGFVMRERFAAAHPDTLRAFLAADAAAKNGLAADRDAWASFKIGTEPPSPALRERLRRIYADGIPRRWGPAERQALTELHATLAQLGGEALVGPARRLDPAVLWAVDVG